MLLVTSEPWVAWVLEVFTPWSGCSYRRGAGCVKMAIRWHGSKSPGPRPHTNVSGGLDTHVPLIA